MVSIDDTDFEELLALLPQENIPADPADGRQVVENFLVPVVRAGHMVVELRRPLGGSWVVTILTLSTHVPLVLTLAVIWRAGSRI